MPDTSSRLYSARATAWQQRLSSQPLRPIRSPFWAPGGHTQTLLGHLLPSKKPEVEGEVIEVDLGDGDRLSGTYHAGEKPVLAYIFHGLGGSIEADYMQRTLGVCLGLGFSAICMNHRGAGNGRGLAREPYHSGRGEDLSSVLEYGRARFPDALHIAVGFSLSGNALLLLLSGERGEVFPDGAIAVNAPIDLGAASRLMQHGLNRIYEIRFVYKCHKAIREKQKDGLLQAPYRVPLWVHLEDVDRIYTAPEGGFADPQDYYARCSTKGLLDRINVPTVLLTAADDPFVPANDYREATISPMAHLRIADTGGHMGYLTADKLPVYGHRWMDAALDHYLRNLSDFLQTNPPDELPVVNPPALP